MYTSLRFVPFATIHEHQRDTGHTGVRVDLDELEAVFRMIFGRPPEEQDPVPRPVRCLVCGAWLR